MNKILHIVSILRAFLAVCLLCLSMATALYAQNPLNGNQGFHVITEGNFTSTGAHTIRGPLAVGANLVLNNSTGVAAEVNKDDEGSYIFTGDTETNGLMVAGSVTWTAGILQVKNAKPIHIGSFVGSGSSDNGTNSPTRVFSSSGNYNSAVRIEGSLDQTPTPAIFQATTFDFVTLFDTYRNNSFGLSNCTANVQLQTSGGVDILNNDVTTPQVVYVNALANGVNYLRLSTTSLTNITGIVFQGTGIPGSSKVLVISVNQLAAYSWNIPTFTGISGTAAFSPYILWNFWGSTTFNLTISNSNDLIGSLFAPNFNLIKSGTGAIHGAIIAKSASLAAGDVTYFPFDSSAPNCCSNLTAGGTITGNESGSCGYDPASVTNTVSASGGTGTIEYRWDFSIDNGTTWTEIAGATSNTYNPGVIYTTTLYRRKARRRGCDTYVFSNTITKTVTNSIIANAGADISQCDNAVFTLIGNLPGSGQTSSWSVVSGTVNNYSTYNNDTIIVTLVAGSTATLRYSMSNGSCTVTDDVIITNTSGCFNFCSGAVNSNIDTETEGTVTTFNLSLQSTPAALITTAITPLSYKPVYGTNSPNTSTFQGAYYIKKTGINGDPNSGTHMVYLKGNGFAVSPFSTSVGLACGKKYKLTAWIAAYTNGASQSNAPFSIGLTTTDGAIMYTQQMQLIAPSSASWNDLNWQRYEYIVTLNNNSLDNAEFFFKSLDNTTGIAIDEVCITEVTVGSYANAGPDIIQCPVNYTMAANVPASGYTGAWSVVTGSVSIANPTSPTTTVTLLSGGIASVRWTVTNGLGCTSYDDVGIIYGCEDEDIVIPSGSFIINMGVQPQTVNNAIKPYGLVWHLLHNYQTPVVWSIKPDKVKDGIDFTYNGVNYRGGPFIVMAQYRTPEVNALIASWQAQGVVGVTTTTDITVPLNRILSYSMNWTLNLDNGQIAKAYLDRAGIPETAYNWTLPKDLNCCNDVFLMPHDEPVWATHYYLKAWNDSPERGGCAGTIWAGCKAGSEVENIVNPADATQRLNFLMQAPVAPATSPAVWSDDHSDGTMPYSYGYHDDPVMQFLGTMDGAQENGAEQIYLPTNRWRSTTKIGVWDPDHPQVPSLSPGLAAKLAFGPAFGDDKKGKVMYQTAHRLDRGTTPIYIAAQRAFFNFSMMGAGQKAIKVASNIPDVMVSSTSYVLTAYASGGTGNFYYHWTSTCAGAFTNPYSATTTFNAGVVTSETNCFIKVTVTDDCGSRVGFLNVRIIVKPTPAPPVAVNDYDETEPGTPVTLNVLNNDYDINGDSIYVTGLIGNANTGNGIFVNNGNGTVTYTPNYNFTGIDQINYKICDETPVEQYGPLCDTATIFITVDWFDPNGCIPNEFYGIKAQGYATAVLAQNSITNPNSSLGAPALVNNNNTYYAKIDGDADYLALDLGYDVPVGDTIRLYIGTDDGASGTLRVQGSLTGTNYATGADFYDLKSFVTTKDLNTAVASQDTVFYIPTSNPVRRLRFTRAPGLGKPSVNGVKYMVWDCLSAVPVANNDAVTICEDNLVDINVLANDSDPQGLALTPSVLTNPVNGVAKLQTNNTIRYKPNADYSGTDVFTYKVCNTRGLCATATVNITILDDSCPPGYYKVSVNGSCSGSCILSQNNPPDAINDFGVTYVNTPITTNVQANDIDPSKLGLTTYLGHSNLPSNGTIQLSGNNIIYTPNPGFVGIDDYNYIICNPYGCDSAIVTIDVRCVDPESGRAMQGSVFNDININGIYDATEMGIANVEVTVYNDVNKNGYLEEGGDIALDSVFTDPLGNYTFLLANEAITSTNTERYYPTSATGTIDPAYPISNVLGRPDSLYIKLNKDKFVTLQFPAVVPVGTNISIYMASDKMTGAASVTSSLDGVTFSNAKTWSPPYTSDQVNPPPASAIKVFVYQVTAATGIRFLKITRTSNNIYVDGAYWTKTTVFNLSTPVSLTSSINAGSDDAEEEGTDGAYLGPGGMAINSPDLELTEDLQEPTSGSQKIGLRFNNLAIPPGASILSARLTFEAVDPDSLNSNDSTAYLLFKCEASDNAQTFTTNTNDISDRSLTNAGVSWAPSDWTTGNTYTSPELRTIVQEIVSRPGWASGNSLAFVISGNGTRSAQSYESSTTGAPKLNITYNQGTTHFLLRLDSTTFPVNYRLTTDNLEDAVVLNNGEVDCANNFGLINHLPPVALPDTSYADQGVTIIIDVIKNDYDPENTPLTMTILTNPPNGTASNNGNGTLNFRSNPGFTGWQTFLYQICDQGIPSLCDTTTVSVLVTPFINDRPQAADDYDTTVVNMHVETDVTANDFDQEYGALVVSLSPGIQQPSNGTVSVVGTKIIEYVPNPGFTGDDIYQYIVCDTYTPGLCDTARVYIHVLNQPPDARPDYRETFVNAAINIPVLENDIEPDGHGIVLLGTGTGSAVNNALTNRGGSAVVNQNGTPLIYTDDYVVYTPPSNYTGLDTFMYRVRDTGTPFGYDTTYVTIKITPLIDLELTTTVNPTSASLNQQVTFTLSLVNKGPSPATEILVINKLTSSYQYISNTGGNMFDPASNVWYIPNLAVDQTVTLNITAKIINETSLKNIAEVIAAGQKDTDSTPNNDDGDQSEDDEDAVSPALVEICNNGIDDDGDNLIDCGDPDCPDCLTVPCSNGVKLVSRRAVTANGSGPTGTPSIATFAVPKGNYRAILVLANFEREHCQDGENCMTNSNSVAGLGDNFASPNFLPGGNAPQITVRFTGPGGFVDKQNPLTMPAGDLGFIRQFDAPEPPGIPESAYYSRESYFIALYESDIATLLGGASSGNISISLPNVVEPKDMADDAILMAYGFIHVAQNASGIVLSGANSNSSAIKTGVSGNYSIVVNDLDNGQEPNELNDGLLVLGVSGLGMPTDMGGFQTIIGYNKHHDVYTAATAGDYTPFNESDGFSASTQFRNGPASGILDRVTIQSSASGTITSNGGYLAAFTIESSDCVEICDNGIDDDANGLADCSDNTCKFVPTVNNATICVGGTATLTASGGVSYQWSTLLSGSSILVSPAATTSYTVTVTNNFGCTATAVATVTVNNLPTPVISGNPSTCSGAPLTLTASGASSYVWSTGGNTASITVSPTTPTTYTVTATDANGCVNTTSRTISINPLPNGTISGTDVICEGQSTTLTASGGSTYLWNNASTSSSITVSPLTTTTYTVVVTDALGCTSVAVRTVNVNAKPPVNFTGASTICPGSITTLSPTTGGTWTSSNPAVATVTNSGVVAGITAGSASFTFTNASNGCTNTTASATIQVKPPVTITGASALCIGGTTTLSPSVGGTWVSNNPSVATITNGGVVTGVSAGSATFTFTNTATGCPSDASNPVTINGKPTISVSGANLICIGGMTTLSPSSGGTWSSTNTAVATVTNGGVVTGVSAGTANFIFTLTATGCPSDAGATVTVGPGLTSSINLNGSVCLTAGKQLTAQPTGGTSPFTYSWTGPSGFTGSTQTVTISNSGTYNLSITDAAGCLSTTNTVVNPTFVPGVTASNTTVCEGATVNLTASGTNATAYLWDANGGNATTAGITVTPGVPSTTYRVTVTNNLACTATASATINVNAKPVVTVTGPTSVCVGSTTNVSPTTGGTWTSSNISIATITSAGVITGVSAGTVTFTFTQTSTGCTSNPTATVTINPKPNAGPDPASLQCYLSDSTSMAAVGTGTWTLGSGSAGTALITSPNSPTSIMNDFSAAGVYNFVWTNAFGCTDIATVTTGSVCNCPIDNNIIFTPSTTTFCGSSGNRFISGADASPSYAVYQWEYSFNGGAFVNAPGSSQSRNYTTQNLGVGTHTFRRRYTTYRRVICTDISNTVTLTVNALPTISSPSQTAICVGGTATITPASGGSWASSNSSVATISSVGLITGVAAGTATFRFTSSATGCVSNTSSAVTVNAKPTVTITGASQVCTGNTTTLSPTTGGTWSSSNSSIATVANNGVVTGISAGTATFNFTSTSTGCISNATGTVTVNPRPNLSVDFNGSICLTDTSQLTVLPVGGTSPYTYSWAGPAFTGTTQTISIDSNGTYQVTVTDQKLCSSTTSAFVNEKYQPLIVSLQTEVCENDSLLLTANATNAISYLWSANAGGGSGTTSMVHPTAPSSTYKVTVTNTIGCSAIAQADIAVNLKPVASITGSPSLCIGTNGSMAPTIGGVWVSTNNSVATISNTGIVSALNPGLARFIFTDTITGCISDTSAAINVGVKPAIALTGPSGICAGSTTTMSPGAGGTWTSTNPSVASIANNGVVTGLSEGITTFIFTIAGSQCASDPSTTINVYTKPVATIIGDNTLCLGETSSLTPTTGGFWTSSDATVASVSPSGLVSSLGVGTATFTFINSGSLCVSEPTSVLTVSAKPIVGISGDSILCVGEQSQLFSNEPGTWVSNNTNVVTANSSGLVTAEGQGQAAFTLISQASGCISNPTRPFLVNPVPVAAITGPDAICININSQLTPTTGGTWTSSNPAVATADASGFVTPHGVGTTTFKFTDSASGCVSSDTDTLLVYNKPIVDITGLDTICVGSTTTLSPTSGGFWQSTDLSVALVSNEGIVTGLGLGKAQFIFVESGSGCVSDPTDTVYVIAKPVVSITGPNAICLGASTTLSPTTGGTWTSNNNAVATVTNSGVVTSVGQGVANFTFHKTGGCASDPTAPVFVNGKPIISISGPQSLCPASTTNFLPNAGGTWVSTQPSVASIDNSGMVSAVSPGSARFIFTETSTGCSSDTSVSINVYVNPFATVSGPPQICIGNSTTLAPTVGGVWSSSNPAVASVSNTGSVIGISAGTSNFYFTNLATGCTSTANVVVTVNPKPQIVLPQSSLCQGSTLLLTAPQAGTWAALNPTVASINNAGLITAHSQGIARFTFTSTATGCVSDPSAPLLINDRPVIDVTGNEEICVGGTTTLIPSTGGTWASLNPSIASINNAGVARGEGVGQAYFVFTDTTTGCSSEGNAGITVTSGITTSIVGDSVICIGYKTQLSSSATGSWASTNPMIGGVDNGGFVFGVSPGKVSFIFTEAGTGCTARLADDAITVQSCVDPDFNVTIANVALNGNVHTNDEVPAGTTYNEQFVVVSKPTGSISNLSVNADGSYVFLADQPGKYIYRIPVCIIPQIYSCPSSDLTITVIDHENLTSASVANVDIATAKSAPVSLAGIPVNINTTANDKCVSGGACDVDTLSVAIVDLPSNGIASVLPNGNIVYTPDTGFSGLDTLTYRVCLLDEPTVCTDAKQVIVTNSPSAVNSVVAADDFITMNKGVTTTINVLVNDSDPQGDSLIVTAQGTAINPVVISQGSYYITETGDLHFTPNPTYTGPVDIVYTVCDDQSTSFCAKATAHFLVLYDITLRVRVYLEGALLDNNNAVSSTGRPLMRDNLRVNPFTGGNDIPLNDPYKLSTPWIDITQNYEHKLPGSLTIYNTIPDSQAVFSVSGENAIVDWVFVELRSKVDSSLTVATRSGLLQRDGDVVDLDGASPLTFVGLSMDTFYVVVRHRSHLGVMSQKVSKTQLVDFTSPNTPVFDFGTTLNNGFDYTGLALNPNVKSGYRALWAGDFNADGKLKFTNPNDDLNMLFFDILVHPENALGNANYNFAHGYYQGDVNLNGKIKFDNPNDDKNLLYAQLLFYPLNVEYLSNFNFFIQQIP